MRLWNVSRAHTSVLESSQIRSAGALAGCRGDALVPALRITRMLAHSAAVPQSLSCYAL